MDTTIEILTVDNWQILKELWLEALQSDSIAYGSSYEENVGLSDDEWRKKFEAGPKYVARVDGEPVGLVGVRYEKTKKVEHVAHIVGFYVDPAFRGRGIGRKLMERALDDLRKHPKITKIELGVNVLQTSAIALYKNLGFVEEGVLHRATKIGDTYYDHAQMYLLFPDKQ
ncbi:MAG: GNAT family N-acetyltransferase [bacterium]